MEGLKELLEETRKLERRKVMLELELDELEKGADTMPPNKRETFLNKILKLRRDLE